MSYTRHRLTKQGSLVGASIGAGLGAGVGYATGKGKRKARLKRALMGAGAGAVAGGIGGAALKASGGGKAVASGGHGGPSANQKADMFREYMKMDQLSPAGEQALAKIQALKAPRVDRGKIVAKLESLIPNLEKDLALFKQERAAFINKGPSYADVVAKIDKDIALASRKLQKAKGAQGKLNKSIDSQKLLLREKRASSQELELLDMMHQGYFGEQAQAALMGVKQASVDLDAYYDVQQSEKVSSISDLYVDPEESRNQRLNTLLRRY